MIGDVSDELELLYSCISVGASSRASRTVNLRKISEGLNPSKRRHDRRSDLDDDDSSVSVGGSDTPANVDDDDDG